MRGAIRLPLAEAASPAAMGAIALIIAAKFGVPILILRYPFAAGWANFVLDGVDGDLLVPLGLPNEQYQPIDKITDWVTYVAIVVHAWRQGWPIRGLVVGLFLFRSVGQAAFLATGNELLLAAFPNFLEPLFLVTVTIQAFQRSVRRRGDWRERAFAALARHRVAIGATIVGYKLVDEWITHVGNIDRSDTFRRLVELLTGTAPGS